MAYQILTVDEHFHAAGPKRILALDGGGLRGILTLGLLRKVEEILKNRYGGDPAFRLCHYFDLIAGTSTGAIIAAALAMGMTVDEVIAHYQRLGREVFKRDWFRRGVIRPRYDERALITHLKRVFGKDRTLGDKSLRTGLLIVTKRLDTGSPWPLGNNPRGRYFKSKATDTWISNAEYPLWRVVRASTAAPSYFEPESIVISSQRGKKPTTGTFVDGGVSPFNNPSLQALMYTTLQGHNVRWQTGADRLLLVSIGTGRADPSQLPSRVAAAGALRALFSLLDDCAALVETMMQWMSSSRTARVIDRDVGDLQGDMLAASPLLTYIRYNVALSPDEVAELRAGLTPSRVASLSAMDDPDNLDVLLELGEAAAKQGVGPDDFPAGFDLPTKGAGGRQQYRTRASQAVVAVPLALEMAGFTYQKWGGAQRCKAGDWLVNNNGDVYTVDHESFERTYREIAPGRYVKTTPVWAEVASNAGQVQTKEGVTQYSAGDYLVFNRKDGGDAYAVPADKFEAMYERAE